MNHSPNALVRRLSNVTHLNAKQVRDLDHLCRDVRRTAAKQDIIREGERTEHVHLIVEGWAASYKVLPDGSRQILSFLIPGDFCDLHVSLLDGIDHGIVALSPCKVAYIESSAIDALAARDDRLARALCWTTLVDEGVLRTWIANVGRREAYERIAHLLCEVYDKMKLVGLVQHHKLPLPLTQADLADATGLTAVHVNRVLQRLRSASLIQLAHGSLTVPDLPALARAGGFTANYLHAKRHLLD